MDRETPFVSSPIPKTLGLLDLVLLGTVAIVNVNVVPPVGGFGWSTLGLWTIAWLAFFVPEAIAVLVLSKRYPGEGGVYLWCRNHFGGFHGFIAGWCYWTNSLFYVPVLLVYIAGVAAFAGGERWVALVDDQWFVGTVAFGWKGGIGTSSRVLPAGQGGWKVGVLVQSNFGGILTLNGAPVGKELGRWFLKDQLEGPPRKEQQQRPQEGADRGDGSVIVVVATDAPLEARNLKRLAARSMLGLARTGSAGSNGSGDYGIAFSTAREARIPMPTKGAPDTGPCEVKVLPNEAMSPLFLAVIEATEEAVYNSLFRATTVTNQGRTVEALPLDRTLEILRKHRLLGPAKPSP